ncbi:MAG TPA: calcium-binding protein [Actinomycetota bacterium]|nr:calcium-binding protein [Actinomycetota bacterium]
MAAALAAVALSPIPAARAASECEFSGRVAVIRLAGGSATISVGAGGRMAVDGVACGDATTATVARVRVVGSPGDDDLAFALRGRAFSAGAIFRVDLGDGADRLSVLGTARADVTTLGAARVDIGTASAPLARVAVAGVEAAYFSGGAGRDALGVAGADVDVPVDALELHGDDGDDQLSGGGAIDVLVGGDGADRLVGGTRGDHLAGGLGDDVLAGDGGRDELDGGADDDAIAAGGGHDAVSGGAGSDELVGDSGDDGLSGGAGDDAVHGGAGGDLVAGRAGADRLDGDGGGDRLSGGGGPDWLFGGRRADALHGGARVDHCYQGAGFGARVSCERPTSAFPLPLTPAGQILVVDQNLKEVHDHHGDDIHAGFGDQERFTELRNFARRMANVLPYAPDVLLVQEVSPIATFKTAARLTERFALPYRAVVYPDTSLWIRARTRDGELTGADLFKKNTAIIVNERTMEFGGGGYLATPQRERDRTAVGIRTIPHHAHALLRERATGSRLSAMSVHFKSDKFFSSPVLAARRRVEWAKATASFMRRTYPDVSNRVLGGEFCHRRCRNRGLERVVCDETRFWRVVTRRFGYQDAVYVANSTSDADLAEHARSRAGKPMRIDYVFAKPAVVAAARDARYSADVGDPNYVADHRANYAIVELAP